MDEMVAKKIIECLENLSGNISLGVDGYVDEVWQVVESRSGRDSYALYNKMRDLGETIVKCGEGGLAREIIRKRRTYGGFTGNTGKAIGRLGLRPTMIGMYGKDSYDPAFEPFHDMCKLISVGDPAICHIFEFADGKAMFPYMENILDFNWQTLINVIGFDRAREIFINSDIIALGYWSSMPSFDNFVSSLCENFIKGGRCRQLFFDFADMRKRDKKSLKYTLEHLAALNKTVPMTLSLNENEAELLFSYYGEHFCETQLEKSAARVREQIGLSEIVIHTPHVAAAASAEDGTAIVAQHYCQNAVITAGAGDTFNGGYMAASLGGLGLSERLIVANATAGFYVGNGYAPDVDDLVDKLRSIGIYSASTNCHSNVPDSLMFNTP